MGQAAEAAQRTVGRGQNHPDGTLLEGAVQNFRAPLSSPPECSRGILLVPLWSGLRPAPGFSWTPACALFPVTPVGLYVLHIPACRGPWNWSVMLLKLPEGSPVHQELCLFPDLPRTLAFRRERGRLSEGEGAVTSCSLPPRLPPCLPLPSPLPLHDPHSLGHWVTGICFSCTGPRPHFPGFPRAWPTAPLGP